MTTPTRNGVKDDGHETFLITPNPCEFEFCKTAEKPYDLIVTAILCVFAEHGKANVSVSSDGREPDWQSGIAFASKTLGRDFKYPIKENDTETY